MTLPTVEVANAPIHCKPVVPGLCSLILPPAVPRLGGSSVGGWPKWMGQGPHCLLAVAWKPPAPAPLCLGFKWVQVNK